MNPQCCVEVEFKTHEYVKPLQPTRCVSFPTSLTRPSSQCYVVDDKLWRITKSVSFEATLIPSYECSTTEAAAGAVQSPSTPCSSRARSRWRLCGSVAIFILKARSSSQKHHVIEIPEINQQEEVYRMVREKDFQKLQQFGGVEGVSRVYGTNLGTGLVHMQSDFKAKAFWFYLSAACKDYSVILLLISASLSLGLGMKEEGPKYGWDEGAAILFYTFLLVAVRSISNFRHAKKSEAELLEKKDKREIDVLRDAKTNQVSVSDIRGGDVVCLSQGDEAPTDGLFINGESLVLNDCETEDNGPFISRGSKVTQGRCRMLVILKHNGSVENCQVNNNLFQIRIQEPIEYIEIIKLIVSVLIVIVLLVRYVVGKHDDETEIPEFKGKMSISACMKILEQIAKPQGRITILTSFSAVMVISIQHGMPFAYTISVYWWSQKLSPIVLKMPDWGTIGFVTTFIIDVSSRLTNQVEIVKVYIADREIKDEKDFQTLREGFRTFLLPEVSHTHVDEALIKWSQEKWGSSFEANMQIIDRKTLNSHWRGEASSILPMCSGYLDAQGNKHLMDDASRHHFEGKITTEKESGLMSLVAYKTSETQQVEESELTMFAIFFFKYSYRECIKSDIPELKKSNIAIKLVVDDDLTPAISIARSLGVYYHENDDKIIEAGTFRDSTDDGKKEKADGTEMMAGCLPNDKAQFIKSLKEMKHVVAFIGSLKDAEAMVEADVRIIIGEEKPIIEISGIFLSFCISLHMIVLHGRNMYFNIQKLIQFELTAAIASLFISLFFTVFYGDSPLAPFQLIWINMIMFMLGLPVLLMKVPDQMLNLITTKESHRKASAVTKKMKREIIAHVVYQIIVTLALYYGGNAFVDHGTIVKPMIFNCFVLCQVLNMCTVLKLEKSEMLKNYIFLGILVVVLVIQVILVQFVMGSLFHCYCSLSNH